MHLLVIRLHSNQLNFLFVYIPKILDVLSKASTLTAGGYMSPTYLVGFLRERFN